MKLNQLMLCLDCDEVSTTGTDCPLCASRTVIELQKWIPPISILDTPDERRARRDALFAEARIMAKKMTEMMNEVEPPEPLGCGA